MNVFLDLFLTFARIGICTFGGGYAMLPFLQRELVDKKSWITESELADTFAISQCIPGVIAVNTATFIGYKQRGNIGGVIATLGMIFPSLVIIGIIAGFLQQFSQIEWVAHAFVGIRACVCALIFTSVWKIFKSAIVSAPTAILYCAALVASAWFGLSPTLVVVAGGILGLAIRRIRGWNV